MPEKEFEPPRILLLSLVFSPDGVSTAMLMTQLARELRRLGHGMVVLTTTPHYNADPEILAGQPLTRKWGRLLWQSQLDGIPVYHAHVRSKGRRIFSRLVDYLSFHLIDTAAGVWLRKQYDLILAPSPPLTVGLSAALLAAISRVPFVYNVQEIYPDVAVRLGVLRNRGVIRLLKHVERYIYSRAKVVVVISETFRHCLIRKGVPAAKIRVIPNFVDLDALRPGDKLNEFSIRQKLTEHFVVLYAGNIGLTQDFESIVDAASRLQDLEEIVILIVGDGARRGWLERKIRQSDARNVRLLPYQPASVVPQIYASSDVCLVSLRPGMASETFPSKIYSIMAAGRPAVVSAEQNTDLASIVTETGCGLAVTPGDPEALADTLRGLYGQRHLLKEMGRLGRELVVEHHSPQAVARQYHELACELTSPARVV